MNFLEQAIRAALNKGDASDMAFRRSVYSSASSALERSFTVRPFTDKDMAVRRQNLLGTIRHVESEFIVAVEAEASQPLEVPTTHEQHNASALNRPVVQNDVAPAVGNFETNELPERQTLKRVKTKERRQTGNRLSYVFNGLFIVALLAGGYWAYVQGKQIYLDATKPNTSGQKPVLAEATSDTGREAGDWIEIFSARDTDLLSPAAGANAEIVSYDGISYVKMTGDSTSEVAIKIGSGLVQSFAGKRILFNIKARNLSGTAIDTGTRCDFGSDTKCERKRFKIGPEFAEYMFAVDMSASVSGDGVLQIAPDLAAGGGAIEFESIRASIVAPDAG